MKRINFLFSAILAIVLLASCEKVPAPAPDTTYTINMMMSVNADAAVQIDLTAFEYNEAGEKIGNNTMERAVKGSSKKFTASKNTVKVKIYVKMYAVNGSGVANYQWVQQVYYLDEGKDNVIDIKDDTRIGKSEP